MYLKIENELHKNWKCQIHLKRSKTIDSIIYNWIQLEAIGGLLGNWRPS